MKKTVLPLVKIFCLFVISVFLVLGVYQIKIE